jgi:hypothetical protein
MPIFVIKKKSGRWCLLQDLRAVNKVLQLMGTLQPGLLSPTAIPLQNYLHIIDLKDCFFTIPLQEDNKEKLPFSLPMPNHQAPYEYYHWKILPQSMANSLTMCQEFVAMALLPLRQKI